MGSLEHYQHKQLMNYARLLKKLANKESIKVVCQGDSMTYGQDLFSKDKRPAKSDPTCESDAVYSYHEQAGKTYPESLQEFCHNTFGDGVVTVINRGYSGDWAEISMKRWKHNPQADIHFLMLGTNDATTNDYVVPEVQQNIEKYVEDMSKLVEQILDFGSVVVLLTPPKHSNETDFMRIAYRKTLKGMGRLYQVPVIDTTPFFKSYPYDEIQSDDVHYNSKGYRLMAAKITGILASMSGLYDPLHIRDSTVIVPSFYEYGITLKSNGSLTAFLEEDCHAPFGVGAIADHGLQFRLPAKTKLTFSFVTEEDHLVIVPLFKMSDDNCELDFELDFAMDQGKNGAVRFKYAGCLERVATKETLQGFLLPTKGYYTMSVENPSSSDNVAVYGFSVRKDERTR